MTTVSIFPPGLAEENREIIIESCLADIIVCHYISKWADHNEGKLSDKQKDVADNCDSVYEKKIEELYRLTLDSAREMHKKEDISSTEYAYSLNSSLISLGKSKVKSILTDEHHTKFKEFFGSTMTCDRNWSRLKKFELFNQVRAISQVLQGMGNKYLPSKGGDETQIIRSIVGRTRDLKNIVNHSNVQEIIGSFFYDGYRYGSGINEIFGLVTDTNKLVDRASGFKSEKVVSNVSQLKETAVQYYCHIYECFLSVLKEYFENQMNEVDKKMDITDSADSVSYISNIYEVLNATKKKLSDFSTKVTRPNAKILRTLDDIDAVEDVLLKYSCDSIDGYVNELRKSVDNKWNEIINTISSDISSIDNFDKLIQNCKLRLYCRKLYSGEIKKENEHLRSALNLEGSTNAIDKMDLTTDRESIRDISKLFSKKYAELERCIGGHIDGSSFWGRGESSITNKKTMVQVLTKFNELSNVMLEFGTKAHFLRDEEARSFYSTYRNLIVFCQQDAVCKTNYNINFLVREAKAILNDLNFKKACAWSESEKSGSVDAVRVKARAVSASDDEEKRDIKLRSARSKGNRNVSARKSDVQKLDERSENSKYIHSAEAKEGPEYVLRRKHYHGKEGYYYAKVSARKGR